METCDRSKVRPPEPRALIIPDGLGPPKRIEVKHNIWHVEIFREAGCGPVTESYRWDPDWECFVTSSRERAIGAVLLKWRHRMWELEAAGKAVRHGR